MKFNKVCLSSVDKKTKCSDRFNYFFLGGGGGGGGGGGAAAATMGASSAAEAGAAAAAGAAAVSVAGEAVVSAAAAPSIHTHTHTVSLQNTTSLSDRVPPTYLGQRRVRRLARRPRRRCAPTQTRSAAAQTLWLRDSTQ